MGSLLSSSDDSVGPVLDNHMSIQAAAGYSGYNEHYLRKLAKVGTIKAIKIGQGWSLEGHHPKMALRFNEKSGRFA